MRYTLSLLATLLLFSCGSSQTIIKSEPLIKQPVVKTDNKDINPLHQNSNRTESITPTKKPLNNDNEQKWNINDFVDFASQLNTTNLVNLPTIENKPNIYSILLNSFDQGYLLNTQVDPALRLNKGLSYIKSAQLITKQYQKGIEKGHDYKLELMHSLGLSFSIADQIHTLTDNYKSTPYTNFKKHKAITDELTRINNELSEHFRQAFKILEKNAEFTYEQRVVLTNYILINTKKTGHRLTSKESSSLHSLAVSIFRLEPNNKIKQSLETIMTVLD